MQGRYAGVYKTVAGAYKGCDNRWLCGAHSQQTIAIISLIYERTHPPNIPPILVFSVCVPCAHAPGLQGGRLPSPYDRK